MTNKSLPLYAGYPYLIIRLIPSLNHISLLSEENTVAELIEIAKTQAKANQLHACLALGATEFVYIEPNGEMYFSTDVPLTLFVAYQKIQLSCVVPLTEDLRHRRKTLVAFGNYANGPKSRCLVGDLNKGGGPATINESVQLRGRNEDGSPKGLTLCQNCNHYRGQCLDPDPKFKAHVVKVHCVCENKNLCAFCGKALYRYKLNANFYLPEDGQIHHVPAFCALDHECEI